MTTVVKESFNGIQVSSPQLVQDTVTGGTSFGDAVKNSLGTFVNGILDSAIKRGTERLQAQSTIPNLLLPTLVPLILGAFVLGLILFGGKK